MNMVTIWCDRNLIHETRLEGVVQPVDRDRVDGADHLQHAVEVVELLENLQDLDDPRQHGDPFLVVHHLYNTSATQIFIHKPRKQTNDVGMRRKEKKKPGSLLKPQREVGGVADHAEQVWRVLLSVLFGPDTAH